MGNAIRPHLYPKACPGHTHTAGTGNKIILPETGECIPKNWSPFGVRGCQRSDRPLERTHNKWSRTHSKKRIDPVQ